MDGGLNGKGFGLTIDFCAIGEEFKASGWSAGRVALVLNQPRQTVERWFDGSQPRYTDGLVLIRLYAHVVELRTQPTPQLRHTCESLRSI